MVREMREVIGVPEKKEAGVLHIFVIIAAIVATIGFCHHIQSGKPEVEVSIYNKTPMGYKGLSWPNLNLLTEEKKGRIYKYVYTASYRGNLLDTKEYLEKHPEDAVLTTEGWEKYIVNLTVFSNSLPDPEFFDTD